MKTALIALTMALLVLPVQGLTFTNAGTDGTNASPGTVTQKHPARVHRAEKKLLFQSAGVPRTHRKYYVVDQTVPPALGGSNNLANLQLQSRPEAKAKDRVEKYLVTRVKKGEITVEEARREIQDWKHVQIDQEALKRH